MRRGHKIPGIRLPLQKKRSSPECYTHRGTKIGYSAIYIYIVTISGLRASKAVSWVCLSSFIPGACYSVGYPLPCPLLPSNIWRGDRSSVIDLIGTILRPLRTPWYRPNSLSNMDTSPPAPPLLSFPSSHVRFVCLVQPSDRRAADRRDVHVLPAVHHRGESFSPVQYISLISRTRGKRVEVSNAGSIEHTHCRVPEMIPFGF